MLFYVGRFSYNLTCNILVYLGSFSCTLHASSCGQFLLHVLCCFMSGVSLTHLVLFPVGSFTDTLDAVLCGEFLLHASYCSILGISLTPQLLFYVGIFSYIALAALCGEFLLHPPCCFMWGLSLPRLMLFYVRSFSYMLHAVWFGEFLLHALCCFMWGVSLTRPLLFYVGSFSFTPLAGLCGESYSTLIEDAEKESKSLEKRENGKVCGLQRGTPCIHCCTRHRLCWYPDGKHGPIGAQRPLTQVTWQVRAYWRAGATASPRLASSAYSLARLRTDMTISVLLHVDQRR